MQNLLLGIHQEMDKFVLVLKEIPIKKHNKKPRISNPWSEKKKIK